MYMTPRGSHSLCHFVHVARTALWSAVFAFLLSPVGTAHAEITKTDVQVAARALGFVSDPLSGPVRVGIVYAAGNPRSVRQAQSLRSILSEGLRVGTLELRPVLVESADVARADVELFFLTEHLAPHETPNLLGENAPRRLLCITTDLAQVRGGACIMGVQSTPKIEVYVNRAAAQANDIAFSTAFRVLITEL